MARSDPYSALRYREFRFFIGGKLLLTVAVLMQEIIIAWMIYAKTKDPLSLGLIYLTEAIPALTLALPAGYLADHYSRRKLMLIATVIMLFCSVLLSIYAAFWMDTGIWPAYTIIFIIGIARGLYNPAQASFWAQLVPKELYINSSIWNSSMWQVGAVAGPAIGGLCYGLIGPSESLIIVCVLIFMAMLSYSFIGSKPIPERKQREPVFESLKAGVRFFFNHSVMLSAITLDLFAVLFGGAVALLPAFADEVLHTGPEGLGILRSAPAIGAVIMSVFQAFYPPRRNAGIKMLVSVACFGLCMIGFALSASVILSFTLLLLSGMFDNISVVIRSTILQTFTPEEMRGRVSAVNSIFVGSSNELGGFESGVAARILGLVPSVIFGGIMTILVTLVTFRLAPKLKKLDL